MRKFENNPLLQLHTWHTHMSDTEWFNIVIFNSICLPTPLTTLACLYANLCVVKNSLLAYTDQNWEIHFTYIYIYHVPNWSTPTDRQSFSRCLPSVCLVVMMLFSERPQCRQLWLLRDLECERKVRLYNTHFWQLFLNDNMVFLKP